MCCYWIKLICFDFSQVGFIDYIAHPLWETWADLVHPDCQEILDLLECNRDYYQSKIPISPSASSEESEKQSEQNGDNTTSTPATDCENDITITTNDTPTSDPNRFQFDLTLEEDAQNENIADDETQPLQQTSTTAGDKSNAPSIRQHHIHFSHTTHEDIVEEADPDSTEV